MLVPNYYWLFRNGWEAVPVGLLVRIRAYAGVRECVVLRDLGSRAGTYVRMNRAVGELEGKMGYPTVLKNK